MLFKYLSVVLLNVFTINAKNYFFVPEMTTYATMLCESGLPLRTTILCPNRQNFHPFRTPIFKELNADNGNGNVGVAHTMMRPSFLYYRQQQPPQPQPLSTRRHINSDKRRMSKRRQQQTPTHQTLIKTSFPKLMKKIYLIPWTSTRNSHIKPIVDFLLIPDDILDADAPLDVIADANDSKALIGGNNGNTKRIPKSYITTTQTLK